MHPLICAHCGEDWCADNRAKRALTRHTAPPLSCIALYAKGIEESYMAGRIYTYILKYYSFILKCVAGLCSLTKEGKDGEAKTRNLGPM